MKRCRAGRASEIAVRCAVGEGARVRPTDSFTTTLFSTSLLIALVLILGCEGDREATEAGPASASQVTAGEPAPPVARANPYVGAARCADCHAEEMQAWQGSQHDEAMMAVSEAGAVRGAFDGRTLENDGVIWRFLRADEVFAIERAAPDEEAATRFDVVFTFGVEPLQQYLVERPDGRMQALPVAWETSTDEVGGGRWFSLTPGAAAPPGDPLHWDGLAYNWNSQCASCHSTSLEKRFDGSADTYDTRYAELDVACESCHGPGGAHAEAGDPMPVEFESASLDVWRRPAEARIAQRQTGRSHDRQLDACGGCHSRREAFVDGPNAAMPFLDAYRPRLIEPGLYFDDGQIQDEVYVWGSFGQSRMYAAGVRCNDCHDPHTLEPRREGNALCTSCHAPDAYDVAEHRGHAGRMGADAIGCVDCHMPERTYMEVDARRDHGFLIPRPTRSAALGSPNVCAACHSERDATWGDRAIATWRGERVPAPHWSDALVRGAVARTDAARWLEVAADVRATDWVKGGAWMRYAREADAGAPSRERLAARLLAAGPLERLGLIELVSRLAPAIQLDLLRPMLDDPRRAIRVAAAEVLSGLPSSTGRPADRSKLARVLREYREAQEANAERPEAQVNLGVLAMRYGEAEEARAAYSKAIQRAPYFVPAHVNLADLERALGNDAAAIGHLRDALRLEPSDVWVRYALGLALHRAGDPQAALVELARAADGAGEPRLVLAHALSLDGLGRGAEAIEVLTRAAEAGHADGEIYQALVSLLTQAGREAEAAARLEEWRAAFPADPRLPVRPGPTG